MKNRLFTSFLLDDSFSTSSSIWGFMETVKKFDNVWLPFDKQLFKIGESCNVKRICIICKIRYI